MCQLDRPRTGETFSGFLDSYYTIMELTKDITAEKLHFPQEQKILTDMAEESKDLSNFKIFSENQLFERVENLLLQKILDDDKAAYFQLGLLYFEQVHTHTSMHACMHSHKHTHIYKISYGLHFFFQTYQVIDPTST